MRGLCFAAVLIALSPSHAQAQDYTNATNAAWCAGALGAYAVPTETGATYLDHARSRHLAVAQEFFGPGPDKGATMLIFENLGSVGAAACNRACAAQQQSEARAACFDASPDCKRIIACLTD
jgi:hypothetical protein